MTPLDDVWITLQEHPDRWPIVADWLEEHGHAELGYAVRWAGVRGCRPGRRGGFPTSLCPVGDWTWSGGRGGVKMPGGLLWHRIRSLHGETFAKCYRELADALTELRAIVSITSGDSS